MNIVQKLLQPLLARRSPPFQVVDVTRFAVSKPDAALDAESSAAHEVDTILLTLSQVGIESDWGQPRAVL